MKKYLLKDGKKPSFISEQKMDEILSPNGQGAIDFSNGEWNNKLMKDIGIYLKVWNVKTLTLVGNKNMNIIKELQPIGFQQLNFLSLWFNNIESIQGLCRVRMPTLTLLFLANNSITKIGCLRKLSAKLVWVELYENPIIDAKQIVWFNSIQHIYGYVLEDYRSNEISPDLSWTVKIKAKEMLKLFIKNEERMVQKELLKVIRKRFKKIRIFMQEKV